ncbi:MAG TPA: hypothetical protein VHG91_15700, partial [Longimicrobium sp.]|nr:hypothetical protein [Longimicrobium sp.]
SRAAPRAPWTPDDELARVARAEVPGFAGYWLRDDGTPVVRLVDPSRRAAAERYLAPHLAAARRGRHAGAARTPVFLGAAYDFARLKGWADALHPLLARSDVFMIDVDEVENRVLVGAADGAAVAAVRAEAARLGVPAAALEVRTQPRPEVRDSLRGGVQIAFGTSLCTLGFNATSVASGQSLFVTNSHCTLTNFGFDGGTFYHPVVGAANVIGREIADRGLYPCNGPGSLCRKSDAAYVGHLPNASHPVAQGAIVRTAWASGGPGGTTAIGAFDIVARYTGFTPVGSWLDKTGRTTGSTYGQVTNSCVSFGTLVCQDVSKVYSQGGDSGAPVYVYLGGSGAAENDVQLQGILWGGPSGDPTTSYSSRLSGIEADLGALTGLCRPGYGC